MEERKKNHIDLAFESQTSVNEKDERFFYEPLLSSHPKDEKKDFIFLGKNFSMPFWVSSMTGGTAKAGKINRNLARACNEFGIGMGLGSCRMLLDDNTYFSDFDMREIIGEERALYANLGISQIERALDNKSEQKIHDLVLRLKADGLIIHVNPLQEWIQPEGDKIVKPPIETVEKFLDNAPYKVIVKEVGQGMGPESIRSLLQLPLEAIEFAAFGGTNFARVELHRRAEEEKEFLAPFARVGEDALSMVEYVNALLTEKENVSCRQLIISGGIKNYLDGYYLIKKSSMQAIYGQASKYLEYAQESYESLAVFIEAQIKAYKMAEAFLRVKE